MNATLEATRQQQDTHATQNKPRLYDFAEGWGSIYGRYVRNNLCHTLVSKYNLRSVLEAPCNAESYFSSPGTQSVVFAEEGCTVTLVHPDRETIDKTRDFWAALDRSETPILHHTDLYHLPFEDNTFDLVWNFDSIPLFSNPTRFLAEMERVSRHLIMVILPNPRNVGYPIHRLLMKMRGTKSVWGSPRWMESKRVTRVLEGMGMEVISTGLVDMPPWPGFDVLHTIGKTLRQNTVEAGDDTRTDDEVEHMLRRLTFIEYAHVPRFLKTPFAHQRYLIARKWHI